MVPTSIGQVVQWLEHKAPLVYQESYDNSGLLCGNPSDNITGLLTTLDVTEDIIDEAILKGCNLIVSHHPLVFKPIKSLVGSSLVERCLIKAIKSNIAIYCIHTNLDNIIDGVNKEIASRIGLQNVRILSPKKDTLLKLTVFVPQQHQQNVLSALHQAGAGNIGNYSNCSFSTTGTGSFTPNEKANPTIGKTNQVEHVQESRIEVLVPIHLEKRVLGAMHQSHPYEEVAYFIQPISNLNQEVGSGAIGQFEKPYSWEEVTTKIKDVFGVKIIRHTLPHTSTFSTIAVCGGSGSFLIKDAIRAKADLFITADVKYHDFFIPEKRITLADIGHYESEVFTKNLLVDIIRENFTNIAVHLSDLTTNPIIYS